MDVRKKSSNEKRLIDYVEIRRLFDAQYKETVQLINDGETHLNNLAEGFTEADRIIQKIPTVDAVEVVRCKDCKYGEEDDADFPAQYLCRYNGADWNCGNHFCSYGERKVAIGD